MSLIRTYLLDENTAKKFRFYMLKNTKKNAENIINCAKFIKIEGNALTGSIQGNRVEAD
jgi:hypothetical protein